MCSLRKNKEQTYPFLFFCLTTNKNGIIGQVFSKGLALPSSQSWAGASKSAAKLISLVAFRSLATVGWQLPTMWSLPCGYLEQGSLP